MHAPQTDPLFCSVDGYRRDKCETDPGYWVWVCPYCSEVSEEWFEGERA